VVNKREDLTAKKALQVPKKVIQTVSKREVKKKSKRKLQTISKDLLQILKIDPLKDPRFNSRPAQIINARAESNLKSKTPHAQSTVQKTKVTPTNQVNKTHSNQKIAH